MLVGMGVEVWAAVDSADSTDRVTGSASVKGIVCWEDACFFAMAHFRVKYGAVNTLRTYTDPWPGALWGVHPMPG